MTRAIIVTPGHPAVGQCNVTTYPVVVSRPFEAEVGEHFVVEQRPKRKRRR